MQQPTFVEQNSPYCCLPGNFSCSFLQSTLLSGENALVRRLIAGGRSFKCLSTRVHQMGCNILGSPAGRIMETVQFPQLTNHQALKVHNIQETELNRTTKPYIKVSPLFYDRKCSSALLAFATFRLHLRFVWTGHQDLFPWVTHPTAQQNSRDFLFCSCLLQMKWAAWTQASVEGSVELQWVVPTLPTPNSW